MKQKKTSMAKLRKSGESCPDKTCNLIRKKLEMLRSYVNVSGWKWTRLDDTAARNTIFDDSGWAPICMPHVYSSAEGPAWFRATIALPGQIEGISIIGSNVELDQKMAVGAEFFINGKSVYSAPSWADTGPIPLVLTKSFLPGMRFACAVRANQGDGFGLFAQSCLIISNLEEERLRLETFLCQLRFCQMAAEDNKSEMYGAEYLITDAMRELNMDALRANDWNTFHSSADNALAVLLPFNRAIKKYRVHLIGHSHIDMNWLWPWPETVDICRRDFTTVDSLMNEFPELVFSQSQTAAYQAMEDNHPDVYDRIKARIKEKRWDVTASTWVECDVNLAAGETLVRQILYACRYAEENLGVSPVVFWAPDTFGHSANLPQILAKSGIKYYYHVRCGKGPRVYWWKGLDNSKVLAFWDPGGCCWNFELMKLFDSCREKNFRHGLKTNMVVFGIGDHGGAPARRDLAQCHRLKDMPLLPELGFSSVKDAFEDMLADGVELPVVKGELNPVFEGCYTSHGDIKRYNRECERMLVAAETICSAALIKGCEYPLTMLSKAWQKVCFNQFHDILCGCAVGITYKDAVILLEETLSDTREAMDHAFSHFAKDLPGGEKFPSVFVWNPLPWERNGVAMISLPEQHAGGSYHLRTSEGVAIAAQVLPDTSELLFEAPKLPAMGYAVFEIMDGNQDADGAHAVTPWILSNELIELQLNPQSGAIMRLYDKKTGKEFCCELPGNPDSPEAKINVGTMNLLQVAYEQPHPMSAWNIGPITRMVNIISGASLEIVDDGPVRAAIRVKHCYEGAAITQLIYLCAGARMVEIVTSVDWSGKRNVLGDIPMLRALFNVDLEYSRATFDIPYGNIERIPDGKEHSAQKWVDISDGQHGLTLFNDCKHGHSVCGNTISLTLLRSSYEPDGHADVGEHAFRYGLYPHSGDWRAANSDREGMSYNQPVQAWLLPVQQTVSAASAPKRVSFLRVDAPNIMFGALKQAENKTGVSEKDASRILILRLQENHGKETDACVDWEFDVAKVEEADLMEKTIAVVPATKRGLQTKFGRYEIKTFKLYLE